MRQSDLLFSKTVQLSILCCLILNCGLLTAQEKTVLYLIPGQGSDARIFKNWPIDTARWEVHILPQVLPPRNSTINEYAHLLAVQIDTTRPFAIVGISLGGMAATEMSQFLHPAAVVIVSSAKCRAELPGRYTWMSTLPVWRLFPPFVYKYGSFLAQNLVEPDRRHEKTTCNAMLKDKDARFLKRATGMIVNWNRTVCPAEVMHVHGASDHTLPIGHVQADITIKEGSHMMTITRGETVWASVEMLLLNRF
jgi:pimeloyl-ACP methyl ester carboxylesterase